MRHLSRTVVAAVEGAVSMLVSDIADATARHLHCIAAEDRGAVAAAIDTAFHHAAIHLNRAEAPECREIAAIGSGIDKTNVCQIATCINIAFDGNES